MNNRKISFLLLLLFFFHPLASLEITLERAITPNAISWGLMGRNCLPPNHGMIFFMPKKSIIGIWMFNCFMDLSVAFLDDNFVIQEIRNLKSYPEKMDPARPVKSLEEMAKYPSDDPVRKFFLSRTVKSTAPTRYFVEMRKGWFTDNDVRAGDRIILGRGPNAEVKKTR